MNTLGRIMLTLKLIKHNEEGPRIERLEEIENSAKRGSFKKCERLLLRYVQMRSVHAVNRTKSYSILMHLSGLQCLLEEEQTKVVEEYQITENEEKTDSQP